MADVHQDIPPSVAKLAASVAEQWGLSGEEMAKLIGTDHNAYERQRAILRAAADLETLYRDDKAIRVWLREPQSTFYDTSPLEIMMDTRNGPEQVAQYVEYLSGR